MHAIASIRANYLLDEILGAVIDGIDCIRIVGC